MTEKRYFKVVKSSTDFEGGRYKGSMPLVAAKKAARKVLGSRKGPVTFVLKETTKSVPTAKRSTFAYQAIKVTKSRPEVLDFTNKNGEPIRSTHTIKLKAIKKGGMRGGDNNSYEYDDDDD